MDVSTLVTGLGLFAVRAAPECLQRRGRSDTLPASREPDAEDDP